MTPDGVASPATGAHPTAVERMQIERVVMSAMQKPGIGYWMIIGFFGSIFAVCLLGGWGWQIYKGMGVAGITSPVGWGVYITNFVFWVGIAHSGTLISAVLYLLRAKSFRSSFNGPWSSTGKARKRARATSINSRAPSKRKRRSSQNSSTSSNLMPPRRRPSPSQTKTPNAHHPSIQSNMHVVM